MEDAAYYLSEGVITLAFLCAAARLLHRSLRTHAAPERLLGASFLLWGLSYPLYNIPEALGAEQLVMAPFANAARISWQTGTAIMALFALWSEDWVWHKICVVGRHAEARLPPQAPLLSQPRL